MKKRRLQQFAVSFLIVLSFLMSSVSACTCNLHHQEKIEAEAPSCHQQAHETKAENQPEAASTEMIQTMISDEECCCVQPAPKVFAKSENLKVEKQAIALLLQSPIELRAVPPVVSIKTINFEPPFYLSDSFYNLAPSRGPPRL